ncbi:hypothetical protein [Paraburkholderia atlantica]|uniref:Uncharacterized protein n=1 Tax=Paraburkholderia atlantica TaxID=2654982 RepID=D5WCW4_PARAM|nr:hypothetical protein [Paraburkholderia atlantica]ADG14743.1 conserved hypothetical protein [Paraburkholderia atlantica]MBB5505848.1 hypothetical protein [Paraburkholderia atlantica]
MATLARRVFKIALFLCLFVLSVRYVRPYPYPMTESQLAVWWHASDSLGIRDPGDLVLVVWVTIELIAAALAYMAIMSLWRWYRA